MSEKLDLLIKECGEYLDAQIVKFEVKYKKFTEDYNKAIANTQEFEIFKANGDDTKIWPKDVFPDKPEIKTYGDLYKWLFNPEYGSVYYDKKLFSDDKTLDSITGEEEKNPKVTPTNGGGDLYHLPTKLYQKLEERLEEQFPEFDPVQSAIYNNTGRIFKKDSRKNIIISQK